MLKNLAATLAVLSVAFAAAFPALADGPGPAGDRNYGAVPRNAPGVTAVERAQDVSPQGRAGKFPVASGAIQLTVPTGYYYYGPNEARAYLQRINAPAPSGDVLGMIALAQGPRPIDDGFWAAVISYQPIGFVSETGAQNFASPDFVKEVQQARGGATGRQMQGFAAPPAHDSGRHAVTWTERYPAPNEAARSLRNEQRLLGREGVAGTTIDARPDQMPQVNAAGPQMLNMIGFTPGKTFSAYRQGQDPAPRYDLAGLLTRKPMSATPAQAAAPTPTPAAASTTTPSQNAAAFTPTRPATTSSAVKTTSDTTDEPDPLQGLMSYLPWIGGGLLLLGIIPALVGRMRRDRTVVERETVTTTEATGRDPNLTPAD